MLAIAVDMPRIEEFCHRWKVAEFALFGSVLREDFRPDSDVDVLVTLQPNNGLSLYDWIDMIDELKEMFGRDVDLVDKEGLKNPIRRKRILETCEVVYAA